MATALKHKLSYHRRLFLLLLVFSWTLVGCFILFQYGREKHFKAERLDAQLQLFNLRMLDAVNAGAPPDAFIARSGAPCEGVRVTLIDRTNHHLFQPLLYQVATGILSEGEIAPPTREILRRQRNARVIQGLVTDVDLDATQEEGAVVFANYRVGFVDD